MGKDSASVQCLNLGGGSLTERVLRDPATLGSALAAVDQDHCHGPHPLSPFALAD